MLTAQYQLDIKIKSKAEDGYGGINENCSSNETEDLSVAFLTLGRGRVVVC